MKTEDTMKRVQPIGIAAAILLLAAGGTVCSPSGGPERSIVSVPAGTRLDVRLGENLGPTVREKGDRFTARLEERVPADGKTAIPAAAPVHGEITVVREPAASDEPGVLSIAFRSVEVAGERRHLSARVIGLDRVTPRGRGRRTLRVTDRALDARGESRIEFGAADGDPFLPEGAVLRLRLTAPIDLPARFRR